MHRSMFMSSLQTPVCSHLRDALITPINKEGNRLYFLSQRPMGGEKRSQFHFSSLVSFHSISFAGSQALAQYCRVRSGCKPCRRKHRLLGVCCCSACIFVPPPFLLLPLFFGFLSKHWKWVLIPIDLQFRQCREAQNGVYSPSALPVATFKNQVRVIYVN